jgi:hypothetical protein
MRYRALTCSRPGYLNTPLASGRGLAEQADLFAALLDALAIERVSVVTVSAGGTPGLPVRGGVGVLERASVRRTGPHCTIRDNCVDVDVLTSVGS